MKIKIKKIKEKKMIMIYSKHKKMLMEKKMKKKLRIIKFRNKNLRLIKKLSGINKTFYNKQQRNLWDLKTLQIQTIINKSLIKENCPMRLEIIFCLFKIQWESLIICEEITLDWKKINNLTCLWFIVMRK